MGLRAVGVALLVAIAALALLSVEFKDRGVPRRGAAPRSEVPEEAPKTPVAPKPAQAEPTTSSAKDGEEKYSIAGTVRFPGGALAPGIAVRLESVGAVVTDREGRFSFAGLDATSRWNPLHLEAEGDGYGVRREVLPGECDLDVELKPLGGMEGTVLDARGNPAPDVEVRLADEKRSVETDGRGGFAFTGLIARVHTLVVGRETPRAVKNVASPVGGTVSGVVVRRNEDGTRYRFRTVDEAGHPLSGASVSFGIPGTFHCAESKQASDSKGRLTALSCWAGENRGYALAHSESWDRIGGVDVPPALYPGDAPETMIVLRPSVTITFLLRGPNGEVLSDPSRIWVEIHPWEWTERRSEHPTDRRTFVELPGERIDVSAGSPAKAPWPRYGFIERGWTVPHESRTVELRLQPYVPAFGRVLDSSGRPVEGARVDVCSVALDLYGWLQDKAMTDAAGRFETHVPADGWSHAEVHRGNDLAVSCQSVANDAREVDVGDLVLAPPVTLSGVVLGPDDQPEGGVEIWAKFANLRAPASWDHGWTVSHGDGHFRIQVPHREALELTFEKDGLTADPVPVTDDLAGQPISIRMRRR